MATHPTSRKKSSQPAIDQATLNRHEQFMREQQAKGLLHPEQEWEERVNRGLRALFGPAPARRLP